MKKTRVELRKKRHARIRIRVRGTAEKPRLVVFRSLKGNYAQLVDDTTGRVMLAQNDRTFRKEGNKTVRAKKVGVALAKAAAGKSITACVFDRNGYKYHGRVKALADGAREGGLRF